MALISKEGRPVGTLDRPIWFDTGLKMKCGTPRTVAAYNHAQLRDYKSRKTSVEDMNGNTVNEIPWRMLAENEGDNAEATPVDNVTTVKMRPRKNG